MICKHIGIFILVLYSVFKTQIKKTKGKIKEAK